ncbi:hypothetical protein [Chungangia koreensis]
MEYQIDTADHPRPYYFNRDFLSIREHTIKSDLFGVCKSADQ